jgi:YD repeat-containing protein
MHNLQSFTIRPSLLFVFLCIFTVFGNGAADPTRNQPHDNQQRGRIARLRQVTPGGLAGELLDGLFDQYLAFTVLPQSQIWVTAAVDYDPDNCTFISSGAWTVTTPPVYGVTATGIMWAYVPGCPNLFPFGTIYYTWTSTNPSAQTDYFAATWSAPDGQVNDYVNITLWSDPGPCNECEAAAGAPINLTTGDIWISKTEYSAPGLGGGLSLIRTWNSLWSSNNPPFLAGMFGADWTSNFEERLQYLSPTQIEYWLGAGNVWVFQQPSNCPTCAYTVATPPNQHATLAYNSTTEIYTLTFAGGTTKTFNSQGYLTALTDRNGNQTTITYDSSQRISGVTTAGGQALTFAYALPQTPNLVTSIQDSVGTVATYSYAGDTGVLLSQVVYADGSQLNYAYDANENITSVTDSQGKILETHTYDAYNRGLTSARAYGVDAISVQYATGATTLTDSMGNMTTYSYTPIVASNFLTSIQGPGCDSCGGRNNYTYTLDSYGDRISTTDPNGNTVSFTYDSSGNLLTRTDAVGTWTYTYNGFAEVLTAKDPLSNTTTNVYDGNGNLTSTTTPAGSTTQFTYNGNGELTRITGPLNNATNLTYYATGLVSGIRDAAGDTTSFGYDGRGNRTSVTDALSDVTSFSYDTMNRLTLITYADGSTTQFRYDIRGRRISVTDANGNTTWYAYDDADRLVRVKDPAHNVTAYAYDTENNLLGITDALGRTTTFQYDNLGRVTETLFPSSLVETYGYDNNGNLISKTDRNGNTISYAYDPLNRLTQKTYSGNTVSYAYDADSRLATVTDSTGTYQLTYDAMGRLTGTTTNYSLLQSGVLLV